MSGIYLKAAVRNIAKHKLYSAISITGLALGIAVSLMIALFIRHETSFDKMYTDHDRMYRLNWENLGTGARFATFFNPVSPILAQNLPNDIEAFTRIAPNQHLITNEANKFAEQLSFVDPNFFDFFTAETLAGDIKTSFNDVQSSVFSEAAALKIFGTTDVVGRTFSVDGQYDFRVGAVIKNLPANTHITGNIFIHIDKTPELWGWADIWQSMGSDQFYHYIKLQEGVSPDTAYENIMATLEKLREGTRGTVDVPIQPITDVHFTADLQNEATTINEMTGEVKPFRQRSDIYVFISVAVLTFAIAAFNFMNMQVVQTTNRVKEVGIRKVLGARRSHVIMQFLLEASILAGISMLCGLMIAEISLPWFAERVAAPLKSGSFFSTDMLVLTFGSTLLAAAIAGIYPALVISRHLPSSALRGEAVKGSSGTRLRSVLVVAQFAIAIGLISASGVVNGQIDYALSKTLGFNGDNVVTVPIPSDQRQAFSALKSQLETNPAIDLVTNGSVIPTGDLSDGMGFNMMQGGKEVTVSTRLVSVGAGYFEALEMEMAAGRTYSTDFPGDAAARPNPQNPMVQAGLILNETALRRAGFENPEDAIGQNLWLDFNRRGTQYRYDFTLVGVVKDAHYNSIRTEIAPLSFFYSPQSTSTMIVKIKAGQLDIGHAAIAAAWDNTITDYPLSSAVLSDTYKALYAGENRTFGLFIGFAGLAILIACLGLWGLTSYIVERRTKEIGIRKVMGATVRHIIGMLTWDFSKLVIVANFIAWPAAWFVMRDWLSSFAYQADISLLAFLIAAIAAFLLAVITTSSRAYFAAQLNPAQTLRQN